MNDIFNFLLVIASASVMGIAISALYNLTHSRAVYASRMSVAFVVFSILSAMLLYLKFTVGGVAVIGATIIMRFRNPVKDHRDIVYILMAVISGFCCATHMYEVLGIAVAMVILVLVFTKSAQRSDRVVLVVKGDGHEEELIIDAVTELSEGKLRMLENNSNGVTELIYEVSDREKPFDAALDIRKRLYNVPAIDAVHVMYQDDDMSI